MTTFLPFLPTAAFLALLVALEARSCAQPIARALAVAICLAETSWLTLVAAIYLPPDQDTIHLIVVQRDLGYWFGSAVLMMVPFLLVLAAGRLVALVSWPQSIRVAAMLAVTVVGWMVTPAMFAIGWIAGCVTTQYPSCI